MLFGCYHPTPLICSSGESVTNLVLNFGQEKLVEAAPFHSPSLAFSLYPAMAVTLGPTSSCLSSRSGAPHPSLSCANKVYEGLRVQFPNSLGTRKSNLNVNFFNKVYQSMESRTSSSKPTCGCVTMMPIGTPRVPYRNVREGTWQWVDLWNALYRERVIFIGKHIDEEFSNLMLATMLYLDSIDNYQKLILYISSPGGDITPSLALYDTMQSLQSPVATYCLGFAFNMAGFLLAAGEKGSRSAMPLSTIIFQSPAGTARGQADDIQNEAQELLRIRDYLFKELSLKTGQPLEKIHEDFKVTKNFTSERALEYGLIDRIVRPAKMSPEQRDPNVGLG